MSPDVLPATGRQPAGRTAADIRCTVDYTSEGHAHLLELPVDVLGESVSQLLFSQLQRLRGEVHTLLLEWQQPVEGLVKCRLKATSNPEQADSLSAERKLSHIIPTRLLRTPLQITSTTFRGDTAPWSAFRRAFTSAT